MPLYWGSKDSDEIVDYGIDWSAALVADDTVVSSNFSFIQQAGIALLNQGHTAHSSTVRLSGGTNGGTGKILCRITTASGEQLKEEVFIRIKSVA